MGDLGQAKAESRLAHEFTGSGEVELILISSIAIAQVSEVHELTAGRTIPSTNSMLLKFATEILVD